ncbi:hypothetical protein [Nakamurella endophytica]|uniref:Uncharacterized protein n=1 Tax=Nakamurella endophytica TaxID=1748367 RepID=A0A917T2L6_9ACTN|nr:hypothetical protein [Nakamurella endophytica]GGM07097.1 hypothetical protein GCM10011594_28880 [Nakamurella endophytica]
MLRNLRRLGFIGGVVALARSPQGQRAIAKARAWASDPANQAKIKSLAGKVTGSRGRSAGSVTGPGRTV